MQLATAALHPERVRLGTASVPIGPRSAPPLAAAAASRAELAPGRAALGAGVSTEAIVRGWHGRSYAPPLAVARETLLVLRAVLGGQTTDFERE